MRQIVYPKFYIFSACRDNLTVNSNHVRTLEARRVLEESHIDFACVTGVYKGKTEQNFMVFDSEGAEELISTLCKLYNQECYLLRDKDNEGYLVYPNSDKESLGVPKEVTRQEARQLDAFTILPQADNTKKYFTFVKEQ